MQQEYYPGSYYQPLFDHMSHEHGLTLLEGQMADIIHIVNNMQALHPSESAGVNYLEFEKEARNFWRVCYGNSFPYKFSEWVWEHSESPATAQSGKEEKAFAEWCGSMYNWDYAPIDPSLPIKDRTYRRFWIDNDANEYTTSELYDIYKQQNND